MHKCARATAARSKPWHADYCAIKNAFNITSLLSNTLKACMCHDSPISATYGHETNSQERQSTSSPGFTPITTTAHCIRTEVIGSKVMFPVCVNGACKASKMSQRLFSAQRGVSGTRIFLQKFAERPCRDHPSSVDIDSNRQTHPHPCSPATRRLQRLTEETRQGRAGRR